MAKTTNTKRVTSSKAAALSRFGFSVTGFRRRQTIHRFAKPTVYVALFALAGAIALGYSLAATSTPSGLVHNGVGTCLDVKRAQFMNSNPVQLYACHGGAEQTWSLMSDGTIRAGGFCLDAKRAGTTPMTPVQIYSCNGGDNQQWTISGAQLINRHATLCLDDKRNNPANSAIVQLYSCNGGIGQRWGVPVAAGSTAPAPKPSVPVVSVPAAGTPKPLPTPVPTPTPIPAPTGTLWWSDAPASPVGKSAPLQNWSASSWNIVSGSMSVVSDAQKGKAVSFNVGPAGGDKQRVEGTIPFDPKVGQTQYVGFDLKLSTTAANPSSGWQCIMQLKSTNEGNPSFELDVDSGKLYAMSNRAGKPNQKVFIGNAPKETWTRMVLKFYITKGRDSTLAAWQDGKQTLTDLSWESHDNTGENGGSGGLIYSNAGGGYYKFGIYRGSGNKFPMNVRYSHMKIGSTYSIVGQD